MVKKSYPGLFIAFEGLDGSGASIQASLLAGIFTKEGYRIFLTKEPTNSLIGGLIKAHLAGEWKTCSKSLELLFAADRAAHIDEKIMPNLESGKIVITDRYYHSSVAYGSLDDKDVAWLEKINSTFIKPDITFLIKVRPQICAIRIKESHYELELYKEKDKLEKVWKVYQDLAKNDKSIAIIDGERDEMAIIKEITEIVKKQLGIIKK